MIASIDHDLLKYTFFSFVMVQSIGGGLLGGFMMDGRLSSGVRFGFLGIIAAKQLGQGGVKILPNYICRIGLSKDNGCNLNKLGLLEYC